MRKPIAATLLIALSTPGLASEPPAPAPRPQPAAQSAPVKEGWSFNVRYRHESVEDDAFVGDASADTLRIRAGFRHAFDHGWSVYIEGEGVAELDDDFNSGANGETAYPLVPDARALELNQAFLDWKGKRWRTRFGRQSLVLDNARFIGNVAWRQNMQTFDGADIGWNASERTELRLIWLGKAHRPNGDEAINPLLRERSLDARLLHAQSKALGGTWTGYGYWIEDRDVPSASTRTLGARYGASWPMGEGWRFGLTVEAAKQSPYAGANGADTGYHLLEPRVDHGNTSLRLGFERLGASSGTAFQTPLATLHAFNGWADKFLVTPTQGLEDRYASLQGKSKLAGKDVQWQLMAHDFQSDHGQDYGREWDASLGLALRPGWNALFKLADYSSDGFARDTRKVWLQVEWTR